VAGAIVLGEAEGCDVGLVDGALDNGDELGEHVGFVEGAMLGTAELGVVVGIRVNVGEFVRGVTEGLREYRLAERLKENKKE